MRELVSSVQKGKPIIALIESDASRGGLTLEQVHAQLKAAEGSYAKWGFDPVGSDPTDEVPPAKAPMPKADALGLVTEVGLNVLEAASGLDLDGDGDVGQLNDENSAKAATTPSGQILFDHLFAFDPIEWNRIGHFQDVTMRLIAERLLPEAAGKTYIAREVLAPRPTHPLESESDG